MFLLKLEGKCFIEIRICVYKFTKFLIFMLKLEGKYTLKKLFSAAREVILLDKSYQ